MPVKIGLSQHIEGDIAFRVLKWLKRPNDLVEEGDKLALIRDSLGDIQEVTIDHRGILACILVPEGPEDLHGKEIIAVLALADDSRQAVADAVVTSREFNRVSEQVFFDDGSEDDEEEQAGDEDSENDDEQEDDEDHDVILDPEPVVTRRSSHGKSRGFLAGLIGGVVASSASCAAVGSSQPRIGNVIERGHGRFDVYDENGRCTAQITYPGAELKGYTSTQFHLKQARRMITLNVRGQKIGDRSI